MTMSIDNLGNSIVAGDTQNYNNLIASFAENGAVNYAMSFTSDDYGNQFISVLSTSDNGIVALAESNNDGCIHSYLPSCAYVDQHTFSRLIQLVLDVERG
jgi:hypothetical protein